MNALRLSWEPENRVPLPLIDERFGRYVRGRKSGVSILANGTLLFLKSGEDHEGRAKKAMEEAKYLTNFEVDELREGGYLVVFHSAVAVFVGDDEFSTMKNEITRRIDDLLFPSETFSAPRDDKFLIGLYARGKLQRDAFNFCFYKHIAPE